MSSTRPLLASLASLLLLSSSLPGQLGPSASAKARLELLVDRTAYEPGSVVRFAARVRVEPGWHVQAHEPSLEYLIPTELTLGLPGDGSWGEPEITYPPAKLWQSSFETEPLAVYEETFLIRGRLVVPAGASEETLEIEGKLYYQACDDRVCLPPTDAVASTRLVIGSGGEAIEQTLFDADGAAAPALDGGDPFRFAWMILLGLVGGLILNAMPCVLPILSLKVFSLVKAAGAGSREVTRGSLATAAGILASFWALALAAVIARSAGQFVGWGVQFQNPGFVTFLAVVVVLFALNMWGLFEIPLPQGLARLAEGRPKQGLLGHFWWGLFATLMATPCSAPYLGSAVGFALTQQAATILVIFTAIGLGMASPYLVLAAAPGAASLLPRPGAWMEQLRGFMGFLLAGTAIWLLYVLAAQVGSVRLAFIQLGLLTLGLLAWIGRLAGSRPPLRRLAAAGVLLVSLATLLLAARATPPVTTDGKAPGTGRIAWQPWDRATAEALAADGQLVFIDVTADWCATCKFNERLVLETEEVADLFAEHGVVAMQADWTNRDDAIASYLAEFGRFGIPFYVLYRPDEEPFVFGELLTKGKVIEVVQGAAGTRVAERSP